MKQHWRICVNTRHGTVRCRYNTVNFLKHINKRHPIAHPLGKTIDAFWLSFIEYLIVANTTSVSLSVRLTVSWQYFLKFSLKFHEIYGTHSPCGGNNILPFQSLHMTFSMSSVKFQGHTGKKNQWRRPKLEFLDILRRTPGQDSLKFGMLMYPDHLQKWLDLVIICSFFSFWRNFELMRGLCCRRRLSPAGMCDCISQNTEECKILLPLPEMPDSGNKVQLVVSVIAAL